MTPFVGFAPDLDPLTPGLITDCNYCYPTTSGFKTQNALDITQATLPAAGYGVKYLELLGGSFRIIAGTQTKLYLIAGFTATDISRAGNYSISGTKRWNFSAFGNVSLAADISCVLQAGTTGAFADVAGSPKASCMDVGGGFVMLGNVDLGGGAGIESDRWICSGFEDHTDWTPDVTTQCTTGRLVETPGAIVAIKQLGSYFVAYKENSIYLGEYVGAPEVFRWTVVSSEVGCSSSDAIVVVNDVHYFINVNRVYVFDGNSVRHIDDGIREWIGDNFNVTYRGLTAGANDKPNSCIYWFYVPDDGSSSTLKKALVLNYKTGKYSIASYSIECIYDNSQASSVASLAVVDTSHRIKLAIATPKDTMALTTGLIGDSTQRTLISRSKPHFKDDPTSATVADYTSETDGVTLTSQATSTLSNGKFDFFASARFHQLRYQFTGPCEVVGHTVTIAPDGME